MQFSTGYLLLVLVFSSLTCLIQTERALCAKLYGDNEKQAVAEPNQILDTLKSLDAIYSTDNDENSNGRGARVKELIEASEIKSGKCNLVYFLKLNALIEDNKVFAVTYLPYLKHYRNELFTLCNKNFKLQFKSYIDSVEPQRAIEDMADLREAVKKTVKKNRVTNEEIYLKLSTSDLIEGIVTYMNQASSIKNLVNNNSKALLNKNVGEKLFIKQFQLLVLDVCDSIRSEVSELAQIYTVLAEDKEMVQQIDPIILDWLSNTKICSLVQQDPKSIAISSQEMFSKQLERNENIISRFLSEYPLNEDI